MIKRTVKKSKLKNSCLGDTKTGESGYILGLVA